MKFVKPNFNKNLVNISASFAKYLKCDNDKKTLKILDKELNKNYKNIVFIIFDGLGINPLKINLDKNSFLRRNIKKTLTSVFPSTTTSATTTLLTNKYPIEHSWFGWCLYFEEFNRVIDLFLDVDSFTREELQRGTVREKLKNEPFYYNNKSDYNITTVAPIYWNDWHNDNLLVCNELDDYVKNIREITQKEGKQFIYCYCPEPDSTMHKCGVTSNETLGLINSINQKVEELVSSTADTLFIITADHGQVDIDGYFELYKDLEITSMLEAPQYLDARAIAFNVKDNEKEKFVEKFNQKYGKEFALFESEYLIKNNYFGVNITNENAKRLGDYIAISKGNKIMLLTEHSSRHKGHHGSLTKEMFVPLIIVNN